LGVDYLYVNHSKKQYFDIGLFGESCRFHSAGFNFGSRALSLLISEKGGWNNDSIEMINDTTDKSLHISSEYTEINVELELLLLDIDGTENFNKFYNESEFDFTTFSHLCLYAMILRIPEAIELLNNKYGSGVWQKQFKDHYHDNKAGLEDAIYESQKRNIVLYQK